MRLTKRLIYGVWYGALLLVLAAPRAAATSFQQERELGQQFDLAARRQLPLITDPEVVGYVAAIGQKIAAGLEESFFDYHFAVVRNASVNAFAVPGGYVYVHSGLLTRAASDDEVAAVLGHEVAHVHAHHLVRQQESTRLLSYASLLGMLLAVVQPAAGALVTAANQAMALKYNREFEQEADYMGARYLSRTGYDPRAMLDFFKELSDEARTQPTFVPPYLLSHPLTDERLNHLEAVLRTQQWKPRPRPPASPALRVAQLLSRARSEPPAEVLARYRNELERDPGDAAARYLYGLACLETGQFEAAKTALTVARDAGVVAAERDLGRVALRQRAPGTARDLLQKAVEREPNDAGAYLELGKALKASGDGPAAMAAYRRAFDLAPYLEAAHYSYGILAGRAGDQGGGFYHLATAARLGGDYEQALNQYARAASDLPAGDPRTEEARGWVTALSAFLRTDAPTPGPGRAR